MQNQSVINSNRTKGGKIANRFLVGIFLIFVLLFTFSATYAKQEAPKVEINGVGVYSSISYAEKVKTWVDVDAFFHVLKESYELDKQGKNLIFKNETIPVKNHENGIVAEVKDLAEVIDATQMTKDKNGSIYFLVLPEGTVKITPVIPQMGEHWTNPQEDILIMENDDPVYKTIYGVYEGKLVFIEQMISQKYFVEGKSFVNFAGMKGLPSPAIDHTNIEFVPTGHEGYTMPHYDIHHYFITPEEQEQIGLGGENSHH
ncbi:hypothetical protein BACCIP111895_00246 [Neobacillus rhizosphaerae]|uniref:Copper amine oxidase-like N-terminal domain-containing protein n=1 Tax=Neobacillus rhizosphaerae TaxID=2880965 RepID=A0ABM9EKL0_9BACI|nr:hypothetical protein [Neobacillus rhizosphaerae]CAH2713113.1 hypothetical protein BACCIP111895_00246 [Neobacillus rhizosphaerae]